MTRLRLRRRLLLWSAPVVILLLVCAAKLISMSWLAQHGIDDYRSGRSVSADDRFADLASGNVIQRWIAPFDRGDSLYDRGRYTAARWEFTQALRLAPDGRRCTVRHNLALTVEVIGDGELKHRSLAGAHTRYEQALAIARTGKCANLAIARPRIAAKVAATAPQQAKPQRGTKAGPATPRVLHPATKQQQLGQRNQQGAKSDVDDGVALGKPPPFRMPRSGKPW